MVQSNLKKAEDIFHQAGGIRAFGDGGQTRKGRVGKGWHQEIRQGEVRQEFRHLEGGRVEVKPTYKALEVTFCKAIVTDIREAESSTRAGKVSIRS
jgi:hypothetical protein